MALGLYVMSRHHRPLLLLTVALVLPQQVFNLFYAIGDILVYYIPLYDRRTVGGLRCVWSTVHGSPLSTDACRPQRRSALIAMLLFLLPLSALSSAAARLTFSANRAARVMWEKILAAAPTDNAILISNDRDEIVPLFYFQYVEGRAPGLTGIHPLMAPDERFSDIGATVDTALREGNGQPVYLIKQMPGLEIRHRLQPDTPPLVRVGAVETTPSHLVNQPLGGLTLTGYDWEPLADGVRVRLYWRVDERLRQDYTGTVQLLAANERILAQDDRPSGGAYYPTSLWKPGEQLIDERLLSLMMAARRRC